MKTNVHNCVALSFCMVPADAVSPSVFAQETAQARCRSRMARRGGAAAAAEWSPTLQDSKLAVGKNVNQRHILERLFLDMLSTCLAQRWFAGASHAR